MRIVIDMQGAQSESRFRGIGRYSYALALSIAKNYHDKHEIIIVLNGMFPETIDRIRQSFDGILKKSNIKIWQGCSPVHGSDTDNDSRIATASFLRESFLASLNADMLIIMSAIEGYNDNSIISLPQHYDIPTAVVFYDAIPFMQADKYIKPLGQRFEDFYYEKINVIKHADLVFGISESSCSEAINILDIDKDKVVNISSAADYQFCTQNYSSEEQEKLFQKFSITKPFLLYSGATDERKNHLGLIQAFSLLPDEIHKKYQLVLAGGMPLENHIKFKEEVIKCNLSPNSVVFTGRLDDSELVALYNLCYLYVFPSYHEGFGLPALEAMQCGAATIGANTTSVPEVIGREDALFDPFDTKEIAHKIEEVLTNKAFHAELKEHSLNHAKNFSWEKSAKRVINSIETWEENHNKNYYNSYDKQYYINKLIQDISQIQNTDHDLLTISQSIAFNHPNMTKKQLLIDISELVKSDARSGIQRVVRSILNELISSPPKGYTIQAVYATQDKCGYKYANQFINKFLGHPENLSIQDEPIDISPDDIFLGLDMSPHIQYAQKAYLQHLKNLGIHIYFIVYDLLTIQHPEWWPNGAKENFENLLDTIISSSDTICCISQSVENELKNYITYSYTGTNIPHTSNFHLGADMDNSRPSRGLPDDAPEILELIQNKISFIMVGTLEPRKGHLHTLKAFNVLWEQGIDINLVIVGKQGWMVDELVSTIKNHKELDNRLFWLEGISDEYLEKVYEASDCLIAASEGEGFGLPLIEAAQKKKPIIARDISVFREVAGEYAFYFPDNEDPENLAEKIKEWLSLYKNNEYQKSDNMPWLSWKESTEQLLSVLGINE